MGMGVPPLVVPQNSNEFFGTSGDRTWQPSSALGQCPVNSHVIFFLDIVSHIALTVFPQFHFSNMAAQLLAMGHGLDIHHWDEPLLPSLCLAMRSLTLRLSKGQVAFTLIHRSMQAL